MANRHLSRTLRFCLPQSITSARIFFSSWAMFAAIAGALEMAAILIVLGVISDGFDGGLARKLKVVSEFGALFDYFADYLCFIVVPSLLSLLMLQQGGGPAAMAVFGLPLFTGALRYARMDGLRRIQSFEEIGYPGLCTVIYACFVVALFFLGHEGAISREVSNHMLLYSVPALSVLMVAPIRYPKLVKSKTILLPLLVGVGLMPFVVTIVLAGSTLVTIFLYVFLSPLLIGRRPGPSRQNNKADVSSSALCH